jgi:hypothetical protein
LVTVVVFPEEVTSPVKFAFIVTVPAVKPAAVPVMFVPTSAFGMPRFGVVKVLLVNVSMPSNVAKVPEVGRVTVPDPAVAFAFKIVVPEVLPARISFDASKVFAPVIV